MGRSAASGRVGRAIALGVVAAALGLGTAACASSGAGGAREAPSLAGSWSRVPSAPLRVSGDHAGVWTGRALFVVVQAQPPPGAPACDRGTGIGRSYLAALWYPREGVWRRLGPPRAPLACAGTAVEAVWTGRQVLVWGIGRSLAYTPRTDTWTRIPAPPQRPLPGGFHGSLLAPGGTGLVAWTGREMIVWGGGYGAEDESSGGAYDPATRRWRMLPRAPLPGMQSPVGAWDGHELVIAGGTRFNAVRGSTLVRTAAAYDPVTNHWRRIAPLPRGRGYASAVWTGSDLLLVGGAANEQGTAAVRGFAYRPSTGRWRVLAPMPTGRLWSSWVRAGQRVLGWGGAATYDGPDLRTGLTYEPARDAWSHIAPAPIRRAGPVAVWSGEQMILWGGTVSRTRSDVAELWDGAAFMPASP